MVSEQVIKVIDGSSISVKDIEDKERRFLLKDIFGIEEDNLSVEFMQQASVYAFFATLQAKAEWSANMLELSKDQEEAAADEAYRQELERKGKKYTETVIKGFVVRDEQVQSAAAAMHAGRYEQKLLKAICSALEMRAEMLQSLGSHLRHELDQTGLKVREAAFQKSVDSVRDIMKEKRR